MGIHRLQARQQVLALPAGEVLGCSYQWPGGQYCVIHTDRGLLGCGIYDCPIATQFSMAVAICRGTPEHPLRQPEDLLGARVAEVSQAARELGILPGMTGQQALEIFLATDGATQS